MDSLISSIPAIILGAFGVFITWRYNSRTSARERDRMQMELFVQFNRRYKELLPCLEELRSINLPLEQLEEHSDNKRHMSTMYDYLILCAEERYWRKKNRLDFEIWNSWRYGIMQNFRDIRALNELWDREFNDEYNGKSYYLKDDENLFDELRTV